MTAVTLIVTGKLEKLALDRSLRQLFTDVEFTAVQKEGFTSRPLRVPPPAVPEPNADKLAKEMLLAVDPGRRGTPADFAIVIDDLELANAHQPGVVIDTFRQAVQRQLEHVFPSQERRDKTRRIIRERCSFHLLAPMVETYFYAETDALTRAGATRASRVDAGTIDVEDFATDDADFLDSTCEQWARPNRARHPKHYLRFLCDPECKKTPAYRETRGGARALERLDWSAVLAPAGSVRFVRSFIHDLACALDQPATWNGLRLDAGQCHPLTEFGNAGHGLLRNL